MFETHRHLAHSLGGDAVAAAVKSSPPVAVATAAAVGVPVQTWLICASLLYVLLQIAYLVWKWAREWRRG